MECDRKGCNTVMCHRYNSEYGYICQECFNELCESTLEVDVFMSTKKDSNRDLKMEARREFLDKLFPNN